MSTGAARRAAGRGREPREARTPRAWMEPGHTGHADAGRVVRSTPPARARRPGLHVRRGFTGLRDRHTRPRPPRAALVWPGGWRRVRSRGAAPCDRTRPLHASRARGRRGLGAGGGGAQQLEDPRGREGQALDLDAPVGERVLDGGGDDGAGRDHAALADPLDPELVHARGKLDVDEIDRREVAGAWERVVHQRARQELSRAVVDDLLEERAPEALRRAAVDLALDDHRVDRATAVVDDDEPPDGEGAGL